MTYDQLLKYFGSVRRIAQATEAFAEGGERHSTQSIYSWKERGISELWQRRFEELTGGKLQCDPVLKASPEAFKRLADAGVLRPVFRLPGSKRPGRGG